LTYNSNSLFLSILFIKHERQLNLQQVKNMSPTPPLNRTSQKDLAEIHDAISDTKEQLLNKFEKVQTAILEGNPQAMHEALNMRFNIIPQIQDGVSDEEENLIKLLTEAEHALFEEIYETSFPNQALEYLEGLTNEHRSLYDLFQQLRNLGDQIFGIAEDISRLIAHPQQGIHRAMNRVAPEEQEEKEPYVDEAEEEAQPLAGADCDCANNGVQRY
jgi:hypothetical protein